ncbi:hypothetical protein AAG570_010606 [Ranatra chinensis]|uniref:Proteasome subunit beta type-4 n=1 Tax=Ranatra chinensis TaxID=642074 RepID=A0ABD0YN18_9HEMI
MAADIGGYYGSMARFRRLNRMVKVNDKVILAAGGDYADFQYINDLIAQKIRSEEILDDGFSMKGSAIYTWLTRLMYQRRSKLNPLWNSIVVAGFDDGKPFLGAIDKLGLGYKDQCIANGFGSYLAVPLMREAVESAEKDGKQLTKQEAQQVLIKCMEVLYYRDTRSYSKVMYCIKFVG